MKLARVVAVAVLALGALVGVPATAGAALPTSVVVQPQWLPAGATYGDLSARWWQWALQTPVVRDHLLISQFVTAGTAPIEVNCSYAQSGPVWFLATSVLLGVVPPGGVAVRTCTVPAGRALFFPIYTYYADNLAYPGTGPAPGTETPAELHEDAAHGFARGTDLFASIDGQPVSGVGGSNSRYRAQSPLFSYTLPEGNLLADQWRHGYPAGAKPLPPGAAADGTYLLVVLAPGKHVLHWGAKTPDLAPLHFDLDVTYTITVR
jgi:hypothetical protein